MLDVIGAITLTASFAMCVGVLLAWSPVGMAARLKLASIAVLWFTAVAVLATAGLFSATGIGTPAIGLALLAPIILSAGAVRRSPTLRAVALELPLSVLVALHAFRAFGVFFLLLLAADRLPPTFALTAGWGDIAVAIAALPLAWAIHRRAAGSRMFTSAWNVVGFADLVTAVTLGVGSSPDSPARFIFEAPASGAMGVLPWVLVPTLMVPLYLLMHMAIFAQLARARVRIASEMQGSNAGSPA